MNLHHLTFEEILEICSVLDDPSDLNDMIESLLLLEKNIHYLRTSLAGKGIQEKLRNSDKEKQRREMRKQTFRILTPRDHDKEE